MRQIIRRTMFVIKNMAHYILRGGLVTVNVASVSPSERFKCKRVLISGGGSGFGREMARQYSLEGADVIIVGRHKERLERTAKEVATNGAIHAETLDISQVKTIAPTLERIISAYGDIDIFVNDAGVGDSNKKTEEVWDSIIDTNLKGTRFMMQTQLDYWASKHIQGKMVCITSVGGLLNGSDPYRISKWGVACMSAGYAKQYADRGITINSIAPGLAVTPMTTYLGDVGKNEFTQSQPNRRFTRVEDVAALTLFLTSGAASGITGQHIAVDGGWTINT